MQQADRPRHDEYTHLKYRHYERFYRPEIKLAPELRSAASRPTTVPSEGPSRPATTSTPRRGAFPNRPQSTPRTATNTSPGSPSGVWARAPVEEFDDGDAATWARHNRTKKQAPLGCIYRKGNVPGPGHYGTLQSDQQHLSTSRRGGEGLAKFAPPGTSRMQQPLGVSDLGPGQYASTAAEASGMQMAAVKGTLQFGESLIRTCRESKGLPSYSASSPRLCTKAVKTPAPSITEHMRFRSEFDKDWEDGPHLCVSELPHNLDEFLVQRDHGPSKPISFFSNEALERTMQRILESDTRTPVKRKISRTYTFSKSERM